MATLVDGPLSVGLRSIAMEARANSRRWFPNVHAKDAIVPPAIYYALGLSGEAGEAANLVKKGLRRDGEDRSEELAMELADVFVYLLLLADAAGVDLVAAYETKRAVCEERWG